MTNNTNLPGFYDPITNMWSAEKPEMTYNDRRLSFHKKQALLEPGDLGLGPDYPTLQEVYKAEGAEPTYAFYGTFWEVFKDVLNMAAQRIHINNRLKGFWPNNDDAEGSLKLALYPETHGRNVGEVLMLMDSENGEGMEAFRKGGLEAKDDKLPHRSGLFTEIIDTMVRALDFLGGMCAEPGSILVEKVAYNTTRPFRHGKQL